MRKLIQKIGYIVIAAALFAMTAVYANPVAAQSCSGSIQCETGCVYVSVPEGCSSVCNPLDPYGCKECKDTEKVCSYITSNCGPGIYDDYGSCVGSTCCGADCVGYSGRYSSGSCSISVAPTPPPPSCNESTSWTKWSGCSKPCNDGTPGTMWRYNTCTKKYDYDNCNLQACTSCLDNPDAFWIDTTTCQATCGTGTKGQLNTCTNRTRTVDCGSDIPCTCSPGEYSGCTASCNGPGEEFATCTDQNGQTHSFTRSCTYSGPACIDCDWTGFTTCDKECNGTRSRSYVCNGVIQETIPEPCNVNVAACATDVTNTLTPANCSNLIVGEQVGNILPIAAYPSGSERTYTIPNSSFEDGNSNQWIYNNDLSLFSVYNYLSDPSFTQPLDGYHFLAMKRDPANFADPYLSTNWFESGVSNLSGKTIRLRFSARGEFTNNQVYTIGVQSRPLNDDWNNGTAVYADIGVITIIPNVWQEYEFTVPFNIASAGETSSQIRIILRTPNNDYTVYYDTIGLSAIGVVDSVKFYYTTYQDTVTPNYCGAQWTEIPGAVQDPQNARAWTVNWDTTGLSATERYYVVSNVTDTMGTSCTGNPSGVCGTGFTAQCSGCTAVVTPCQLSCNSCNVGGEDDSCGGQCPTGADYGQPSGTVTITAPIDGAKVRPTTIDGNTYTYPIQITYDDPDAVTKADYIEYVVYWQGTVSQQDMLNADSQAIFSTICADADPTSCTPNNEELYYERIPVSGQVTQQTFTRTITAKMLQRSDVAIIARAVNTSCGSEAVTPWATSNYNLIGNVMGEILEDPTGQCGVGGSSRVTLANGLVGVYVGGNPLDAISIINGDTYLLDEARFTPNNAWGQHLGAQSARLVITNDDLNNAYVCSTCNDASLAVTQQNSCASNFSSCTCTMLHEPLGVPIGLTTEYVTAADSPYDFYVERYNLAANPWWQTWSGLVYARDSITTLSPTAAAIADSCILDGQCDPNLIQTLSGPNGNPDPAEDNSAGIPIAATGGITAGDNTGGFYTNRGDNPRVAGSVTLAATQENYSYFARTTDVIIPPKASSGTNTDIDEITDLTAQTTASGDSVYTVPDNLVITIDSARKWSIAGGTKAVVYVAGNLTINVTGTIDNAAQTEWISVEEGSFLGFIVGGNVTFDADMGYTGDSSLDIYQTPNVSGVFIADGTITVASYGGADPSDRKFVGAGTFVGWAGISLPRNFSDGAYRRELNATTPTDTFIYRPDFLINVPVILQRSQYTWQEVN